MKGILCACLLASLQPVAQAYEADVHYSATYVLARAAGWTEGDARTIASADQGVDENPETVAALEVDTTRSPSLAGYVAGSLHQAEKNLRFHCFSRTGGEPGQIPADVREVIAGHFAEVPERDENAANHARRMIALGIALHCQQDAYSHAGFGGSCGTYSGSCFGHTYQTFLDQVVFGLLKKHYYDPDHPAVSGQRLLGALQGTARELAVRGPRAAPHSIPAAAVVALSDALRASGLELPDEVRRDCNRYIAGKWLFDFLHSGGRTQAGSDRAEKLSPDVAATCRNPSLSAASVVRIPDARFPRLDADASPRLVRADGTYQLLRGADFDLSRPRIHAAAMAGMLSNYNRREIKVQLSHWSQLFALPLTVRVALLSSDNRKAG